MELSEYIKLRLEGNVFAEELAECLPKVFEELGFEDKRIENLGLIAEDVAYSLVDQIRRSIRETTLLRDFTRHLLSEQKKQVQPNGYTCKAKLV